MWPEAPTDWEPWGRKDKQDSVRQNVKSQGVETKADQRATALSMRQQALRVLGLPQRAKKEQEAGAKKTAPKKSNTAAGAKPKKTLVEKWEGRRTPQMLTREVLEATSPATSRDFQN